jgi:MYXO-CTERM domain-containing protein
MPTDEDQIEAREALLDLLGPYPYLTRLYARLSPEEMTLDPIFSERGGPDVDRMKQLARVVDGVDQCEVAPGTGAPCLRTTCGPDATCMDVAADYRQPLLPGCLCPEGAAARTTLDPRSQPVAVCQRIQSFLTPEDLEFDPCGGWDCGRGTCVPINATPTCVCDEGTVAVGFVRSGTRRTRCVNPALTIPADILGNPDPPSVPDGGVVDFDAGPRTPFEPGPGFRPSGGGCGCSVPGHERASIPGVLAVLALLGVALCRPRRA